MAYFQIKADFTINPEITDVRKNNVHKLLEVARMIERRDSPEGVSYFVNKKEVAASEYAAEVIRVSSEYERKFKETHKLIWIQQGAAAFSGYYKWIKID